MPDFPRLFDYLDPSSFEEWLEHQRLQFPGLIDEPRRLDGHIVDVVPFGWRQILEATFAVMTWERDHDIAASASHIVQIKEKFGSVRIYVRDGTRGQQAMYQLAEMFTRTACEVCGRPGPPAPSSDACRCPEHLRAKA